MTDAIFQAYRATNKVRKRELMQRLAQAKGIGKVKFSKKPKDHSKWAFAHVHKWKSPALDDAKINVKRATLAKMEAELALKQATKQAQQASMALTAAEMNSIKVKGDECSEDADKENIVSAEAENASAEANLTAAKQHVTTTTKKLKEAGHSYSKELRNIKQQKRKAFIPSISFECSEPTGNRWNSS